MPTSDAMIGYVVVLETGEIEKSGRCEAFLFQDQDTGNGYLTAIDGEPPDPDRYYWDGLTFVEYPPRPMSWARWNGTEWFDPRTAADVQAALYAAREATTLDKSTLLIRMAMAGMLPAEDAEIAAGGVIPPTIQAALDALPPEVFPPEAQMIARIKWRSDNVISRVNPVIVLAAAALGVTDEQMDAIFDVQVPA